MSVSAIVVSHGHAGDLATLLPVLAAQVDELVVIANVPARIPTTCPMARSVIENAKPLPLAANVNLGTAATTGELRPQREPRRHPRARRRRRRSLASSTRHPRRDRRAGDWCGRTGSRQPSHRRFPTVRGTLVRRTPLRRLRDRTTSQRAHYSLDERPDRAGRDRLDARRLSPAAPRRCSTSSEAGTPGFRHYVEDIDLAYRAMRAGWERWYVPAGGRSPRVRRRHRPTASSPATRCGTCEAWRASCASIPRRCTAVSEQRPTQYARKAEGWSDRSTPTRAYLEHRAQLIVELGPPLVEGDEVLDLACGDGGLGEELLRRGLRYVGVDVEPAMVEAAARRLGDRAVVELGDLNTFASPSPVAAITRLSRHLLRHRPAGVLCPGPRAHAGKARLRPESAAVPRSRTSSTTCARQGSSRSCMRPFFVPQTIRLSQACSWRAPARCRTQCPLARLLLRLRFSYLVAAW